jgi:hypothetical protein
MMWGAPQSKGAGKIDPLVNIILDYGTGPPINNSKNEVSTGPVYRGKVSGNELGKV